MINDVIKDVLRSRDELAAKIAKHMPINDRVLKYVI